MLLAAKKQLRKNINEVLCICKKICLKLAFGKQLQPAGNPVTTALATSCMRHEIRFRA